MQCKKSFRNVRYSLTKIRCFRLVNNAKTIISGLLQKEAVSRKEACRVVRMCSLIMGTSSTSRYSPEQMYNVVTDVENYKYFLPFCKKSDVLSRSSSNLRAYLEIGFPPIVESYVSEVTLNRPNYTKAVCRDGKLFHYLVTYWKFSPGLRSNPYSSIVDFSVDFEFRSVLHSNLAHMFFDKLVQQMEGAFLVEAKRRYGQETLPSHVLSIPKS
uniref:Coenzyme Q-binding protein COQ10 START domain-containing protein n=1 Tax=Photinus pyralis TaxID=7054 RepID=A0A1Y1JXP4_PHOPY